MNSSRKCNRQLPSASRMAQRLALVCKEKECEETSGNRHYCFVCSWVFLWASRSDKPVVPGDDGCCRVPCHPGRIVLYSIGQTGFFTDTQDIDNPGDMPCRRRSQVGDSLDDYSRPSRRDKPLVQEHSGKGRFEGVSLDRIVWTPYIFRGLEVRGCG